MKIARSMKFALPLVAMLMLIGALLPASLISARPLARVTGAGEGTFGADLDSDGETDGSFFWVDVNLLDGGAANGDFECLMAGRWDFLDLPLMLVDGTVSTGNVNADKSVTFGGVARINVGDGPGSSGVPYAVTVKPGGPGKGTFKLTVIGAFDGVPGDTIVGNGNYDLPPETVASGRLNVGHKHGQGAGHDDGD